MPVEKSRRARVMQACNLCRSKKYKCDGHIPCSHCQRELSGRKSTYEEHIADIFKGHKVDCTYQSEPYGSDNGSPGYSIRYVKELETSLKQAQAALRKLDISQVDGEYTPEKDTVENKGNEGNHQFIPYNALPEKTKLREGNKITLVSVSEKVFPLPAVDLNEEIVDTRAQEVMDINGGTGAFEFHGPISAVSFLERLVKLKRTSLESTSNMSTPGFTNHRQVVDDFQNEAFSKQRETPRSIDEDLDQDFYPIHAFLFIDNYFKNIHYAYPILDHDVFLKMCNRLWTGNAGHMGAGFKALYFGVMALGALTRVWTEPSINGMNRYEWTNLLFSRAESFMGLPGSMSNLIAVQAAIILSQVCQYQLNSNLAYTYLGIALRTSFSCGINRLTQFQNPKFPQDSETKVVSRTWWALYAMEIETSFIVGRQDMLGMDCCHNRPPPPMNESEFSIIPAMIGLSKIMRGISHHIYWDPRGISAKLRRAKEYETSLGHWLKSVPVSIRPTDCSSEGNAALTLGSQYWPKLQMLLLKLRYLHARLVLGYVFFLHNQKHPQDQSSGAPAHRKLAQDCKDAAVEIIRTIHITYCVHRFFRSWWTNTTYITFALSILLSSFAQEPVIEHSNSTHLPYINQALEILAVMEECEVARNIGKFVQELVGQLLSGNESHTGKLMETYPGTSQTNQAPELTGTQPTQPADFDFDFTSFNFFDVNDPMLFQEGDPSVRIQDLLGARQ